MSLLRGRGRTAPRPRRAVGEFDLQLGAGQLASGVKAGDHRDRADDLVADADVRADHELGGTWDASGGGLGQLDERAQFLVEGCLPRLAAKPRKTGPRDVRDVDDRRADRGAP